MNHLNWNNFWKSTFKKSSPGSDTIKAPSAPTIGGVGRTQKAMGRIRIRSFGGWGAVSEFGHIADICILAMKGDHNKSERSKHNHFESWRA